MMMELLPAIDLAASHGLAAALAALLLLGAWAKLRDPALFRAAVDGYELLPERWAAAVAGVLPGVEALAGVLLLPLATRSAGAMLAAALVGAVTLAVLAALARGRGGVDCGCGGAANDVPIGTGLVVRNAVLVGLALAAALPAQPRALTAIDALTIAGSTLFMLGAWTLANTLLAQQPRLRGTRRRWT